MNFSDEEIRRQLRLGRRQSLGIQGDQVRRQRPQATHPRRFRGRNRGIRQHGGRRVVVRRD